LEHLPFKKILNLNFSAPMKKSDHFNEDSWQDEEPAVTPGFNSTTCYVKKLQKRDRFLIVNSFFIF